MKKCRVVLLSVVSVMALSGCIGSHDYLKDGVKALENSEYDKAIESFSTMIDEESEDKPKNEKKQKIQENNLFEAHKGLAISYFELEEYDKALESYKVVDEYDGTKSESMYRNMAVCAQHLDMQEEAVTYAEKGLKAESAAEEDSDKKVPSDIRKDLYYIIIKNNEDQGKWAEALEAAKEYTVEFPDDSEMEKEITFLETR